MVEEQANNLDMAETGVAGQQDREIVKWPVNNLEMVERPINDLNVVEGSANNVEIAD